MTNLVGAEPAIHVQRAEVPAAVEAEIATREVLCKLDELGALHIPQRALTRADLNTDGRDDFILALCRLACTGKIPEVSTACDQSVIFMSSAQGYQPIKMPGELLDIRRTPGMPVRLLSSTISDKAACPVADGVCNSLYEIRNGELVQAGIE
jgi:hypothetical protein